MKSNEMKMPNENIRGATTKELKTALSKGLTISAKQLSYLALIWRELEDRGEDLSALKSGLATYLPLIAADILDPEAVVRFAGQKTLLAHLSEIPIKEQRKLLKNNSVELVEFNRNGKLVSESVQLADLTSIQVKQVFHDGVILCADTQKETLLAEPLPTHKNIRRRIARKVTFEKVDDLDVMCVAGKKVKLEAVISALEDHYDVDLSVVSESARER